MGGVRRLRGGEARDEHDEVDGPKPHARDCLPVG